MESKPDVGIEGFFALDLRVGRVVAVDPFPEARKPAWKLPVDFGPEVGELRTSAQVTNYAAEELVDRIVVGAVNLGTRRIAGFESQFLVLGGIDPEGLVQLLAVDGDVPPGHRSRGAVRPLLGERHPVGVGVHVADEDHDPLDEAPDAEQAAGDDAGDDLDDALLGVAQVEAVDAEAAEQDAEDAGHHLLLRLPAGGRPGAGALPHRREEAGHAGVGGRHRLRAGVAYCGGARRSRPPAGPREAAAVRRRTEEPTEAAREGRSADRWGSGRS